MALQTNRVRRCKIWRLSKADRYVGSGETNSTFFFFFLHKTWFQRKGGNGDEESTAERNSDASGFLFCAAPSPY